MDTEGLKRVCEREGVDSCNGSIPLRIENGWDAEQESGGGTSGSGVAGDGILPDHAWAAGEAGEPSFSRPLRDSKTVTLAQRPLSRNTPIPWREACA